MSENITRYLAYSDELTSIADAIRAKNGTSGPLIYPSGFVTAIGDICNNFSVRTYPESTDLSLVVGGTNEIAILTDTTMTGWTFRFTEPESASTGDVWVHTGQSSLNTVQILKENSIYIHLHGVYQYENDSWVHKKAYLYQNSAWKDLDIFLYDNGNQCTDMTGGWVVRKAAYSDTALMDSYIYFGAHDNSNFTSAVYTQNYVNFSGYKKIKARMNIEYFSNNEEFALRISTKNSTQVWSESGIIKYVDVPNGTTGDYIAELDIEEYRVSQAYYVSIYGNRHRVRVYDIWLE